MSATDLPNRSQSYVCDEHWYLRGYVLIDVLYSLFIFEKEDCHFVTIFLLASHLPYFIVKHLKFKNLQE